MSIATMTRLASERARQDRPAGGPIPAGGEANTPPTVAGATMTAGSDPAGNVQKALDAIVGWIPSEALAVYIAALAVLPPKTTTESWVWFGLGIVAVIIFAVVAGLDRTTRPPISKLVIVTIVAVVSFATYAAAMPSSPFLSFDTRAVAAAGIVALLLSLLLPRLARILGISPES